jgi:outer membrane lipoprotein-sorting protein
LLIIFIAGCAATSKTVPDLSRITPAGIQRKVLRNFNKLKSFEGKARVIIELPGEGYKGSSTVYINFPDSVYVKTEAMLGIDIGSLFLDSELFGAYAPRENIFYYGETQILDLKDFLQVDIETNELIEVLTGLTQVENSPHTTLLLDKGQYLLSSTRQANQKMKFWVDPDKFVVTKCQRLDQKGRVLLVKEYRRFKTKKGIVLPQIIKITRPQAKERLTVYYTRQKINKAISGSKFKIKTSKNAEKVYWGDIIRPRLERKRIKQTN